MVEGKSNTTQKTTRVCYNKETGYRKLFHHSFNTDKIAYRSRRPSFTDKTNTFSVQVYCTCLQPHKQLTSTVRGGSNGKVSIGCDTSCQSAACHSLVGFQLS